MSMSLLALMAEKFELEQPDADNHGRSRPVDDDADVAFPLLYNDDGGSPHRNRNGKHIHKAATDSAMSISHDDKEEEFEHLTSSPTSTTATGGTGATEADTAASMSNQQETKLLITFVLMVIVGTANKIFQKLQAIPMYNYPNSLNLLQK